MIQTCNMAFFKDDCMKVNGFNEDFIGWGREDSEFAVRLMNSGINRKILKFNAIQYHLWHHEYSRESLLLNNKILQKSIDQNLIWCKQGVNQFL